MVMLRAVAAELIEQLPVAISIEGNIAAGGRNWSSSRTIGIDCPVGDGVPVGIGVGDPVAVASVNA